MNSILPGANIGTTYSPILINDKVAGHIGSPGKSEPQSEFRGLFDKALSDVEETAAAKRGTDYALAVGDVDDLTGLLVEAEQAQMAFQLLVQMRNKVLDSYQEVMRMNV